MLHLNAHCGFEDAAARTPNAYHSKTGTPRGAASLPALERRQQKGVVVD
jgi:hypothetical protein